MICPFCGERMKRKYDELGRRTFYCRKGCGKEGKGIVSFLKGKFGK